MTVFFQKISPTPQHAAGVTAAGLANHSWGDRVHIVTTFKKQLKSDLRNLQMAQCCFCRRQFADNNTVHIEHFVDKSVYSAYTFEIRNLALACGTCNGAKNGHTLHLSSQLRHRAERHGKLHSSWCPALTPALVAGSPYPDAAASFRWVHPHFDDYSDHIELSRGWIYKRLTLKGYRTIRGAKLNQIAALEKRAADERQAARGDDVMSVLAGQFSELSDDDLREAAELLADRLRARRLQAP